MALYFHFLRPCVYLIDYRSKSIFFFFFANQFLYVHLIMHTLKILQIRFQTTTIKQILQSSEVFGFLVHIKVIFKNMAKKCCHLSFVRSLITDHYDKCNEEKVWNIARITKMWARRTNWGDAVWKVVPTGLFDTGLPQTFDSYNMQHPQTIIKQCSTQWGSPVFCDLARLAYLS